MLMKAMTINTESDNPRRNKYLIPVMLLVVVILIGFLAYSAQQKPEAVVIPTISQSVLEEKYGLQVNLVAVTAAGGLVDVRFKFVDGEKVKALLQEPENFPTLQVAGSPVPLSAPEEGRPAEIQYEDARPGRDNTPIEKKLKKGDELIVQIAKEPMGTKGARITSHVSLPGKYLVYMPTGYQIGVSKRISDDRERRRLRDIINNAKPKEGGVIVRTACEGLPKQDVSDDVRTLAGNWEDIKARAGKAKAPALLHSDRHLVTRR